MVLPPLTTANGMMLPTPVEVAQLLPLPKYWYPLAVKVPAVPLVEVRPLLTSNWFVAVPVVTPSGETLPVPPTKLTVAPVLRASLVNVSVELVATGTAVYPLLMVDWPLL